jgi:uncharacterized membrane protein YeaQ/YmgE (transglycosylase-associated protein family)
MDRPIERGAGQRDDDARTDRFHAVAVAAAARFLTDCRRCCANLHAPRSSRHSDRKEFPMGLLQIISMIVVGFIVGALARWFYPGAVGMGFRATSIVGIVGSLIGGVIGGLIWKSPDGKFHPAGWILSIVGALIVLWLYLSYIAK